MERKPCHSGDFLFLQRIAMAWLLRLLASPLGHCFLSEKESVNPFVLVSFSQSVIVKVCREHVSCFTALFTCNFTCKFTCEYHTCTCKYHTITQILIMTYRTKLVYERMFMYNKVYIYLADLPSYLPHAFTVSYDMVRPCVVLCLCVYIQLDL